MLFTNDSSKLTKFFIDNFDDFNSLKKKNNIDDTLEKLYTDIYRADNFIKLLKKNNKIHITLTEVSSYNEFPQTSHMQSNYVMEKARTYVKENIKGYIQCSVKLDSRDIFIYFPLFKNSDFNNLKKYNIYFYWMLVWLKVSESYTHSSCARELKIFGFLTPFKKKLPDSQHKTLSPENCNSGVTTSCTGKGEICIYREEEFFKVFIHETYHILGLDFSAMGIQKLKKNIYNLFPIQSRFEMHEAYTEFWACTLNCLFCSYRLLDDKKDIKTFLQYSDFFLRLEKIFSLFQMTKILKFMGCHYTNLYNSDDSSVMIRKCLYKEDTNVFPYYIAKTILLYNNISFFKWCQRENKNILNFNNKEETTLAFFDFIREKYDNKYMLNDINNMGKFIEKLNDKKILETLRMTIIEI